MSSKKITAYFIETEFQTVYRINFDVKEIEQLGAGIQLFGSDRISLEIGYEKYQWKKVVGTNEVIKLMNDDHFNVIKYNKYEKRMEEINWLYEFSVKQ